MSDIKAAERRLDELSSVLHTFQHPDDDDYGACNWCGCAENDHWDVSLACPEGTQSNLAAYAEMMPLVAEIQAAKHAWAKGLSG